MDAVVRYTINQPGNEQVRSVNAIIGETNDGGLNDIRGLHVTTDHVLDAIRRARNAGRWPKARSAPAPERCATGGRAASERRRAGSCPTGSARRSRSACSRRPISAATSRSPACRFSGSCNLPRRRAADAARVRWGRGRGTLGRRRFLHARRGDRRAARRARSAATGGAGRVRARPHRLRVQQRQRRFRHRVLDVARHARALQRSAPRARVTCCRPDATSPFFEAALEATEEAVYNSLFQATTVAVGDRHGGGDSDRSRARVC